ncbi:MAG: glucosidase [Phycisphaeraceae bacterium]|nr:glucosidase [Phycisphaeraceae bacterium]
MSEGRDGFRAFESTPRDAEAQRLEEDASRSRNWKRWGPYLAERQWGTVREDYSAEGACWDHVPHDHARSIAYRWGEDGLLGICDRQCRLCFALSLWNGRDTILKERLFGLTNAEGNHGEDVKELYYYLDATPTHSYLKGLYKYPQAPFPYSRLVEENRRRGRDRPEFEILETGVFDEDRYFDVFAEYAKAGPNDVLIRIKVVNRGPEAATFHLLPTLWFRNTWTWGCRHEGVMRKPSMRQTGSGTIDAEHETLGRFVLHAGPDAGGASPAMLFTENETNARRLYGIDEANPYTKDAIGRRVTRGETDAVNVNAIGTKVAAWYRCDVESGGEVTVKLRLTETDGASGADRGLGAEFDRTFEQRISEADAFYANRFSARLDAEERRVARQASAGLLWTKQFYHYIVTDWLQGDPGSPAPPASRRRGRNHEWTHLYVRDVLSMPDKWEYPWFAAWDLAFHMIPFARIDPVFARQQLLLFLREWYMHPNGQIPAYEFNLSDVNPPVHAWACWRVYKMTGPPGRRDRRFLASAFQKLLLNFTWWVNRKDPESNNLFSGGFLGLDNIGVFDRNRPLPGGEILEQADGTAWMAFFCGTMLSIALELARDDPTYEDMASKFFEHFVQIADAMNHLGGTGLWDGQDGFYHDQLHLGQNAVPLRARSIVGLIPLCAVEFIAQDLIERLPGFRKRMDWFLRYREDLIGQTSFMQQRNDGYLLAIPSQPRLRRVLRYLLDEREFLSPYGIRSLSRVHADEPFALRLHDEDHLVRYEPGESSSAMFGGNSNWRGPIWFPINYLLIEALERYHRFYGDAFKVPCPTRSDHEMTLHEVAAELNRRLVKLFMPDERGRRPAAGDEARYAEDPHFRDLLLFHEYFHGDTGRGCGASHQTGWTALICQCLENVARDRG